MRLALFADIHANRQAFAACLDAARARGAERLVCLGDIVGYGADPEWAVDTVVGLVSEGAIAVRGNHDNAIGVPSDSMNADAQAAIDWTRGRLNGEQKAFLAGLPILREQGLALGAAIVGSTLLALAAGAWAFVLVARLTGETDDG